MSLQEEIKRLKGMIKSLKFWLGSIPDCLKTRTSSADKEVLYKSMEVWLESLPAEWQELTVEESIEALKSGALSRQNSDQLDALSPLPSEPLVCLDFKTEAKALHMDASENATRDEEDIDEMKETCEQDVKVELDTLSEEDEMKVRDIREGTDGQVLTSADKKESNHQFKDNVTNSGGVYCFMCDSICNNENMLQKHRKQEHGFENNNYPCNKCEFVALRLPQIKSHMRIHDNARQVHTFSCPVCDYETPERAKFDDHKRSKHGFRGGYFPCSICPFVSTSKGIGALRAHINSVHKKIKHPCDECHKVFANSSALGKHKRAIHLKVPYKCQFCDYQCLQASTLKTHIDSKHKGIRHYCDQCTFSSTTQGNLSTHIKTVHEGRKLKKTSTESGKRSMKFHCDMCVYSTAFKVSLDIHIATKHEGRVYNCDQCSYTSNHPSTLRIHIKGKHEHEIHKCVNCDVTFTLYENLKRHNRIAAKKKDGGQQLTCKLCGFTSCLSLEKHMTKEHPDMAKLHHCDECDKAFNSLAYLRKHKKIKHRLERVECDECGKSLATNENLKLHKKSFHSHDIFQDA